MLILRGNKYYTQLHVFTDADQHDYGASAYLVNRTESTLENSQSYFMLQATSIRNNCKKKICKCINVHYLKKKKKGLSSLHQTLKAVSHQR